MSIEQYEREKAKYAVALKQRLIALQKQDGKISDAIRKLPDKAVELYQAYIEYPFNDNFKDYGEDKAKASGNRNNRISLINQSIALYLLNSLENLEKLKITDTPEFKEMLYFLHMLQAKRIDRADLGKVAREFEKQAELAKAQIAHSQKQNSEGSDHSIYIQGLSDGIGRESRLLRQLKAGYVNDYSQQAEERAKELEKILEHVEKHRRETEAKIDADISQAQKRANAAGDVRIRDDAVNGMLAPSTTRATDAQDRTTFARDRAAAIPIGHNPYKGLADTINAGGAGVLGDAIDTQIQQAITNAQGEARRSRRLTRRARIRAEEARTRAKQAETRAKEAGTRSRIAKAYNRNGISDQAARDVENHAKKIEEWEKEVIKNACSIESHNISIESESKSIIGYLRQMRGLRVQAVLTDADRSELTKFAINIEKSETAKNSAIAFEVQNTQKEHEILQNINNELPNELAALRREQPTETAITNLATQDLGHLQNLVDQQRALEVTLRGRPAVGAGAAVLGLIERERNESEATQAIERAILEGVANIGPREPIGPIKRTEATCRRAVENQRTSFQAALQQVEVTERAAAEALKHNAIHMEGNVTDDAEQAIERLQKIKDNLADQDEEGLKNRSKGHLFIDPKVGKFTLNKVWMSVREINSWDFSKSGQTTVEFRPDITQIKLSRQSRDGSKIELEPIYPKRLLEKGIENSEYSLTLKIDGDTFSEGNKRRIGILTYIDKEAERDEIKNAEDEGRAVREEDYKKTVEFDMERANTIHLMIDLVNEKNNAPALGFDYTIETMPEPVIDHEDAVKQKQGVAGWSDEEKRRMCKLDLDRGMLILPNGQEYPMNKFDWTETKFDEENGLTLQYKGPKELSQVNLMAAGSSDIFDEKLLDSTTAVEKT
ncbi:MAG TPA: hypothetical protein VGL94_19180, partial [Ktedonobacteraceae bacterium]